jgi:phosphopantothenoylcysteine decarboxylase
VVRRGRVAGGFIALFRLAFRLYYPHPKRKGTFKIGNPILHIELRRWADVVLIAPCSANTLSKIAHGLCDNLAVSS